MYNSRIFLLLEYCSSSFSDLCSNQKNDKNIIITNLKLSYTLVIQV